MRSVTINNQAGSALHVINDANNIATVTAFSHDGRGVARIDGKAVFIDGALPGHSAPRVTSPEPVRRHSRLE